MRILRQKNIDGPFCRDVVVYRTTWVKADAPKTHGAKSRSNAYRREMERVAAKVARETLAPTQQAPASMPEDKTGRLTCTCRCGCIGKERCDACWARLECKVHGVKTVVAELPRQTPVVLGATVTVGDWEATHGKDWRKVWTTMNAK